MEDDEEEEEEDEVVAVVVKGEIVDEERVKGNSKLGLLMTEVRRRTMLGRRVVREEVSKESRVMGEVGTSP